tara:strand:+ start:1496 stop:1609 length:114 start_codon:yes stop_codon:yes gene_type:complete
MNSKNSTGYVLDDMNNDGLVKKESNKGIDVLNPNESY